MIEINHNKRLSEPSVLCNSSDKDATPYVGDNYNLRWKRCWYEWTESWRPSMTKEDKVSPK